MKHQVEYLFPGLFMPESDVVEIAERDPELALATAPDGVFCFQLFDVEEVPDLGPDFLVIPKPKNKSGRYYVGGTVYTLQGLKDRFGRTYENIEGKMVTDYGEHGILISNAEGNHWPLMIECSTGNWQPFMDADVLMERPK